MLIFGLLRVCSGILTHWGLSQNLENCYLCSFFWVYCGKALVAGWLQGWEASRSFQKLPSCPMEPIPSCFKMEPLLAESKQQCQHQWWHLWDSRIKKRGKAIVQQWLQPERSRSMCEKLLYRHHCQRKKSRRRRRCYRHQRKDSPADHGEAGVPLQPMLACRRNRFPPQKGVMSPPLKRKEQQRECDELTASPSLCPRWHVAGRRLSLQNRAEPRNEEGWREGVFTICFTSRYPTDLISDEFS